MRRGQAAIAGRSPGDAVHRALEECGGLPWNSPDPRTQSRLRSTDGGTGAAAEPGTLGPRAPHMAPFVRPLSALLPAEAECRAGV